MSVEGGSIDQYSVSAEKAGVATPVYANFMQINTDGTTATVIFGMREQTLGLPNSMGVVPVAYVTMDVKMLVELSKSSEAIAQTIEEAKEMNVRKENEANAGV